MAPSSKPKMTEKSSAAQASRERSIAVRQNMDNLSGCKGRQCGDQALKGRPTNRTLLSRIN